MFCAHTSVFKTILKKKKKKKTHNSPHPTHPRFADTRKEILWVEAISTLANGNKCLLCMPESRWYNLLISLRSMSYLDKSCHLCRADKAEVES